MAMDSAFESEDIPQNLVVTSVHKRKSLVGQFFRSQVAVVQDIADVPPEETPKDQTRPLRSPRKTDGFKFRLGS